jgi:hypothetical protein
VSVDGSVGGEAEDLGDVISVSQVADADRQAQPQARN